MAVIGTSRLGYRTLAVLLCLLCTSGVLISEASECDEDDVEEAMKICMEAFNETIEEHMASIKGAPKRKGCCLSSSFGTCIKFGYEEAGCDVDDDEVETAIHNETTKAQGRINNLAKYAGTILCGEIKREHCGESLLHHFDEAVKEIGELNGAEPVGLSVILAIVAAFVYASN